MCTQQVFQIQGDNTSAVSHIVANDRTAGVLHLEVPASYSTTICGSLDDLGCTSVLVLEGYLGGFASLDSHGSGRIGIILPVLLRTVCFRHGVCAGFQIQGDNTGGIGLIVTDDRTATSPEIGK